MYPVDYHIQIVSLTLFYFTVVPLTRNESSWNASGKCVSN